MTNKIKFRLIISIPVIVYTLVSIILSHLLLESDYMTGIQKIPPLGVILPLILNLILTPKIKLFKDPENPVKKEPE